MRGEGTFPPASAAPPSTSAAPIASAAPPATGDATAANGEAGTSTAIAWPLPATLSPLVTSMPPEHEVSIESVARYVAEREPDRVLRMIRMLPTCSWRSSRSTASPERP